ncbi:universal stress protein [Psychromonas aquimarina]|uniref:universal stress protein n=1 Tax=Psychromonas aquimarina TaxID=444919 RepID=UPI00041FAA4E|nr:universal stress protein [Psychromonas aquimarina]
MSYKHILVAVDLSKSSKVVIDKAVSLAKDANCTLSFIFVDVKYASNIALRQPKTGKVIVHDDNVQEKDELRQQLQELAEPLDYPVTNTWVLMGDLNDKLHRTIIEKDVDLLVCGHHHDLWSNFTTSVSKFVKTAVSDLLIVYLEE